MSRRKWIWALGIAVLLLFNGMIINQECKRSGGETVYFELEPIDPRSIMQGDYFRLRYELTSEVDTALAETDMPIVRDQGEAVVEVDERNVARFDRLYTGRELEPGEHLVAWEKKDRVHFEVESFMFQEGHAEAYEVAKYATVKLSPDGSMQLIGLRDGNLEPIEPNSP